ncbi:MAG: nicotinate (nicotinamide) nucleotide adenylyltransferase [Candidatus Kapabacteria bacterium]|nr:nicotinate (nicotinamide) nucleotide adenylyltransferase [Candidatus Kapabacteria bacterium]
MKKIGIFGGSFNPIHIGHLIIAEYFFVQQKLDKVIFVPTYISPFKQDQTKQIADEDRLAMVKLITDTDERFEFDDFEIKSKSVSYTYNTVKHIQSRYPNLELTLLIGFDNLPDLHKWYEFEKLAKMVTFCVANRKSDSPINEKMPSLGAAVRLNYLNSPNIEISSSRIREAIKSGEAFQYLLHPAVFEYLKSKKLYL